MVNKTTINRIKATKDHSMKKIERLIHFPINRLAGAVILCMFFLSAQICLRAQEAGTDDAAGAAKPAATVEDAAAADQEPIADVALHPGELNKDEQIRRQERALLAELALDSGNGMLVKGDYEKAIESYQSAKNYFLQAGTAAENKKKVEKVDGLITKAYQMWADDLASQAEKSFDREKLDEAIAKTKKIGEANPAMAAFVQERIKRYEAEKKMIAFRKQVTDTAIDPGGQEREGSIDLLLEQAKRLYKKGLYVEAQKRYNEVLVKDPFNIEAIYGLKDVNRQIRAYGEERRKVTEAQRIAQSTWKWNEPITTLVTDKPLKDQSGPVEPGPDDTDSINKKLKDIILPRIDFEEATIHQVIRYLRDKSRELDPEGKGVSIVYQSGGQASADDGAATPAPAAPTTAPATDTGGFDFGGGAGGGAGGGDSWDMTPDQPAGTTGAGGTGAAPAGGAAPGTVTIAATDIPLGDAIRFVCESANLDFTVTKYAVLIGKVIDRKMDVKILDVPRGMFGIEASAAAGGGDDFGGGGAWGGGGTTTTTTPAAGTGTDSDLGGSTDMRSYLQGLGIEFPPNSAAKLIRNKTKLWVKNTPENIKLIENFLIESDLQEGQVTIEAKFVEITQNDLEGLGFEWLMKNGGEYSKDGSTTMGGYSDFGSWGGASLYSQGSQTAQERVVIGKYNEPDAQNPGAYTVYDVLGFVDKLDEKTGLPIKVAAQYPNNSVLTGALRFAGSAYGVNDSVMGISSILGRMQFDTIIHALNRADSTDVLSCPKVTTKSDHTAILKVITQRYFPESWTEPEVSTNTNGGSSYTPSIAQFGAPTEIGVILTATPKVDPKNQYMVDLLLSPQVVDFIGMDDQFDYQVAINGEVVPAKQRMPIISRRSVETNVMVQDGETVVLGGMINEQMEKTDDKVPVLGDVPLLGRLFRSHSEKSMKRNLLIFVTARIVDASGRPLAKGTDSHQPDTRGLVNFNQ